MDTERFKALVQRLERESAARPALYQAKVAALTLLGFGILALLLATVGFSLVLLAALAVMVALSGGTALLLLLKLGKLLLFIAIPLWFLVKSSVKALFIRLPAPQGREITQPEAPALFEALDRMRRQMKGPRFHHVLVVDDVNAAVVQRPAFGLVGWPRNYLLLGLPLLESMPPDEALAVVAHEYGHLAGAHSHFSAFIYRLRHTWGTIQAFTDQVQGWLGRLVAPLVRWYAPYFNAYTFVLARANEYAADRASAELVGAAHATHALKRVNLVGPQHQRFLAQTFQRIDHDAQPPQDLMQRWAAQAGSAPAEADALRWLGDALDREGHVTDSHPTLRARLQALAYAGEAVDQAPPPLAGTSAAHAWLGTLVDTLRREFESDWARRVAEPWGQRHAEAQQLRQRLAELRAMAEPAPAQQLEALQLTLRLEPDTDVREALAAFNAAQPDHALGLYLEGSARLERGERAGLDLLARATALDPEATKPACERAIDFLVKQQDHEAAEAYAERWRRRNAMEAQREQQLRQLNPHDALVPHGLEAESLAALKSRLSGSALAGIGRIYLARRVIPADPAAVQRLVGVQLTRWARFRGQEQKVLQRLANLEWPVPLVFVSLDGSFKPMQRSFRALADARLV